MSKCKLQTLAAIICLLYFFCGESMAIKVEKKPDIQVGQEVALSKDEIISRYKKAIDITIKPVSTDIEARTNKLLTDTINNNLNNYKEVACKCASNADSQSYEELINNLDIDSEKARGELNYRLIAYEKNLACTLGFIANNATKATSSNDISTYITDIYTNKFIMYANHKVACNSPRSDIYNTVTRFITYYLDNNKYPTSPSHLLKVIHSNGVTVKMDKTNGKSFTIYATHNKCNKLFVAKSGNAPVGAIGQIIDSMNIIETNNNFTVYPEPPFSDKFQQCFSSVIRTNQEINKSKNK